MASSISSSSNAAPHSRQAGANMEVMQPHSGHSYSSWAISSFVRGDGPDLRDPREVVDRGPSDLPEGIVPAVDQRLGPGRVEPEDLQQVDEGGRVRFPVDAPLRTACGGRDRRRLRLPARGGGRPFLHGGRRPEARVALVADDLPGVSSAAFGTRGLSFELAGLAKDRCRAARFAEDEREKSPPAGGAGAK